MDTSDTLQPKKTLAQRAMTAGLLITGASILVNLVFYVTGLDMEILRNPAMSWLNRILLVGFTFFFIHAALRKHRDEDLGFLGVGQGIGLGTLAGLISGILGAVWFFIFTTFIDAEMMANIKEITMEQMQAMEMMSFFFSPVFFTVIIVISSVFFGLLCGLVAGLVLKKDKAYM